MLRWGAISAGVVAVTVAAVAMLGDARERSEVLLGVAQVRTIGSPPEIWNTAQLTDSLVWTLALKSGRRVRLDSEVTGKSPFILNTSITVQASRLQVNAQLLRRRDSTVVWGTTFWRSPTERSTIITEIAEGVVEALIAADSSSPEPRGQR